MKNLLAIDDTNENLISSINDGSNRLFINGTEIDSSEWVGTGYYTKVIEGQTVTIKKVVDLDGNIIIVKLSDYNYELRKAKSGVSDLVNIFYPVGSYYETSDNDFNPNTAWGGTWELETEGLVHIGSGSNYTIGATGGEKEHKLTVGEMASHTHGSKSLNGAIDMRKVGTSDNVAVAVSGIVSISNGTENWLNAALTSNSRFKHSHIKIDATHEHNSVGGNGAHNNMQPYVVVNRWHRIA